MASPLEIGIIPETVAERRVQSDIFEIILSRPAALGPVLRPFRAIVIFKVEWWVDADFEIFLTTLPTRLFLEIGSINAADLLVSKWSQPQKVEHLLFLILIAKMAGLFKIFLIYIEIHFVLVHVRIVILAFVPVQEGTV